MKLLAIAFILLSSFLCDGKVIKTVQNDVGGSDKFSPYYAAFSEELKSEMREYERLKRQLLKIHKIDWNVVAKVKAFESESSE